MPKRSKHKPLSELLRVPAGGIELSSVDPSATPQAPGGKATTKEEQGTLAPTLADLQERLFAHGRTGGRRSFLLVLQGLDSSGKGGTIKHVVGQMDPQGVKITAFQAPTPEERRHDFLWRIRRRLPEPGLLGVFDRSHYEDVVTVRVRELARRSTWSRRYGAIERFEKGLADDGVAVIKCYLHISRSEFIERQLARLDDPTKHWKYNPGDLDERALWPAYREAYEIAIERTNTETAPWHVVPADKKWFRNLAIATLLLDALRGLELQWPKADFDVATEKRRLQEEDPVR